MTQNVRRRVTIVGVVVLLGLSANLPDRYPPVLGVGYCNEEGLEVLRKIAEDLADREVPPN